MASSHFLCSQHLYSSSHGRTKISSFKKGGLFQSSSWRPNGSFSFDKKTQFQRTQLVKAMAADSKAGKKQVEVPFLFLVISIEIVWSSLSACLLKIVIFLNIFFGGFV